MAISLSRAQAASLAWVMACPGSSEAETRLIIPHVEAMIDQAVKIMADNIVGANKYYQLQDRFAATLATDSSTGLGAVALSNAVIADTIRAVRGGQVWAPAYILPLIYLPYIDDLYLYHPGAGQVGFYTVKGGNYDAAVVYAANYQGAAITGTINIVACKYPTFATLPAQLEDEFVQALADMAREKLAGKMPTGGG